MGTNEPAPSRSYSEAELAELELTYPDWVARLRQAIANEEKAAADLAKINAEIRAMEAEHWDILKDYRPE